MVAYKDNGKKMIKLNRAKGYIIKHVIEPQEAGAGLEGVHGDGS